MIHVDSSFAIDLLREQGRRVSGPASAWIEAHPDESLAMCVFVCCELETGAAGSAHPERERARTREFMRTFTPLYPDTRFAAQYGVLLCAMQRRGRVIGEMDLLIATAAVVDGASLITGNEKHFEAVPDLIVVSYR